MLDRKAWFAVSTNPKDFCRVEVRSASQVLPQWPSPNGSHNSMKLPQMSFPSNFILGTMQSVLQATGKPRPIHRIGRRRVVIRYPGEHVFSEVQRQRCLYWAQWCKAGMQLPWRPIP